MFIQAVPRLQESRKPKYLFIFLTRAPIPVAHDTGKTQIRHSSLGHGLVCVPRRGAPILGFSVNGAVDPAELMHIEM
jgi:hypothetical protein